MQRPSACYINIPVYFICKYIYTIFFLFTLHIQLIALVAKTTNLQKVPFAWHIMSSEDYQKQVKATGAMKKFDFIHMIQVLRLISTDL